MMADSGVWAAVMAVADRLMGSRSLHPQTSGDFVRTCVRRHVSDGWTWAVLRRIDRYEGRVCEGSRAR